MFLICTKSSGTTKSTVRPSCLDGVLYDISQEKICWWLSTTFT